LGFLLSGLHVTAVYSAGVLFLTLHQTDAGAAYFRWRLRFKLPSMGHDKPGQSCDHGML
jgi:acyl dehydratase